MSTIGQIYSISAKSNLFNDQDNDNNDATKSVKFLFQNDIGVAQIIAPISSSNLTASETIVAELKNFGGEPQTNFNLIYTLDRTTVNEVYRGTLAGNSSANYSFSQTGNITTLGNHTLSVTTNLPTDTIVSNNS